MDMDQLKSSFTQLFSVLLSLFSGLISALKDILGDTEPIPTAAQ